jgi:hypothetical protein
MSKLTAEEKEILALFDEGGRLKDIARKSVDRIDSYLQAAPLFQRAAMLFLKVAENEETEPDNCWISTLAALRTTSSLSCHRLKGLSETLV